MAPQEPMQESTSSSATLSTAQMAIEASKAMRALQIANAELVAVTDAYKTIMEVEARFPDRYISLGWFYAPRARGRGRINYTDRESILQGIERVKYRYINGIKQPKPPDDLSIE